MKPIAQLETRAPLYRRLSELALFDMAVAAVVACSPSEMYKDVVFKVAMQMIGLPAVILSQSLPRGGCEWRLDALFDTAGVSAEESAERHTPARPTKQGTHDTIKRRRIACLHGSCCGVSIQAKGPQAAGGLGVFIYLDLLSYAQSRFTAHACRYTEHVAASGLCLM